MSDHSAGLIRRIAGRSAVVTALVASATMVAAVPGFAAGPPQGSNGTVKLDGAPFSNSPNNEPHVDCSFHLDFFGFDAGSDTATVTFQAWPPSGQFTPVSPTIGHSTFTFTGSGVATTLDHSETYELDTTGLTANPQQGYHIAVTTDVVNSQGVHTTSKQKRFWVQPCTPPAAPNLAIDKDGPATGTLGDTGDYTLTVSNAAGAGDDTDSTITVTDTLPAGESYSSFSGTGWTLASNVGGVLTFTHDGPLAAGDSLPVITVTVTYTATGDQTDTGHVNPATGETDTTDNDDSVTTTVTAPPPPPPAAPNLAIVKSGPSTGTLGSQGQYTLTVSNAAGAGDDTDTTITVTDALPSGEAFVSSSGTGWTLTSNVGGLLTFTHAGPLAAGVSLPPITVTVTYTAVGGHTDTGTVVAATNETDTTDNTSQVTTTVSPVVGPPAPPAPNLAIVKSGPAAGVVGGEGAYTLTVSNAAGAGDDTDSTITVTDTLPAGEAYLSSSGTGWTLVSNNGSLLTFSHAGPLAAGQSLPVLTVTVTYTATGAQTDTAVVLPATGETDTSDNESSATTTVSATTAAAPDLTVVKHALSDRVTGGDTLLYTLTVTNVGAGSTTGAVTVTDQVPAGLTGISAAGIGWQCHLVGRLVTCVWTGGQVAPGVTLPVITVTTTVLDTAVGTLVNTAVVHTPHDINTGNDTSTVTTPVIQVLGEKQTRTPAPRTPAPAVEPESLPFTGANSAGLASFGVLLLAAGAAVLGLGRRRPKGRHAA